MARTSINDAASLTATITGTSGGNFEHLVVGTGTATAHVNDTITDATVNLSASTVIEGAGRELRVHGDAVERLARRHHDPHRPGRHHDCGWPDHRHAGDCVGQWRGRLSTTPRSLTATITGTSGGNFEHLVVGTGTATAHVNDTITDATVNLSASTVLEGAVAQLRVHGDAVERLARRHHDPHRPGRHHDCGRRRPPARW